MILSKLLFPGTRKLKERWSVRERNNLLYWFFIAIIAAIQLMHRIEASNCDCSIEASNCDCFISLYWVFIATMTVFNSKWIQVCNKWRRKLQNAIASFHCIDFSLQRWLFSIPNGLQTWVIVISPYFLHFKNSARTIKLEINISVYI